MDALALLEVVSNAYRNLQSFEAEVLATDDSSDEESRNYSEQRIRFAYVAPNLIRIEHPRRTGGITVADGRNLHHFFGKIPGNRYSKTPIPEGQYLPGVFSPEHAWGGGQAFLFDRINELVSSAETLPADTLVTAGRTVDCERILVTYESSPPAGFLVVAASPITFWVDTETHLIVRKEHESTTKMPDFARGGLSDGELRTTKHTFTLTRFAVDQPIAPETFTFEPPKDAVDISAPHGQQGCFVRTTSGGFSGGDGKRQSSHHTSRHWDGDTLVENSKWTFRGHEITFQRRFTLSDNETEMLVQERIIGPQDETERSVSVRVA
jgi:outer membrane lipoprotein-sorting protein